jgi:hypothetical protein
MGSGDAMPTLDDEFVAFSTGLPNDIYRSCQIPGVYARQWRPPDADGWKDAMDREMDNLRLRDVYDLMPRVPGIRTLRLGWVLHRRFRNGFLRRTRLGWLPEVITNVLVWIMASCSRLP